MYISPKLETNFNIYRNPLIYIGKTRSFPESVHEYSSRWRGSKGKTLGTCSILKSNIALRSTLF